MLTVILMGCVTTGGINNSADQKNAAQHSGGFFSIRPSDREIFTDAVLLSAEEKEPQYNEAKIRLENLIQPIPKANGLEADEGVDYQHQQNV